MQIKPLIAASLAALFLVTPAFAQAKKAAQPAAEAAPAQAAPAAEAAPAQPVKKEQKKGFVAPKGKRVIGESKSPNAKLVPAKPAAAQPAAAEAAPAKEASEQPKSQKK